MDRPENDRRPLRPTRPDSSPEAYGLTVTVEHVTPQQAEQWLTRNHHHRPINPKRVAKYAERMTAGEWSLNGKSLTFDHDGVLLGGQHRLSACVQSGVPFLTLVVRGLNPDHVT